MQPVEGAGRADVVAADRRAHRRRQPPQRVGGHGAASIGDRAQAGDVAGGEGHLPDDADQLGRHLIGRQRVEQRLRRVDFTDRKQDARALGHPLARGRADRRPGCQQRPAEDDMTPARCAGCRQAAEQPGHETSIGSGKRGVAEPAGVANRLHDTIGWWSGRRWQRCRTQHHSASRSVGRIRCLRGDGQGRRLDYGCRRGSEAFGQQRFRRRRRRGVGDLAPRRSRDQRGRRQQREREAFSGQGDRSG